MRDREVGTSGRSLKKDNSKTGRESFSSSSSCLFCSDFIQSHFS